jgi:hypothetical protein
MMEVHLTSDPLGPLGPAFQIHCEGVCGAQRTAAVAIASCERMTLVRHRAEVQSSGATRQRTLSRLERALLGLFRDTGCLE